MKSIREKCDQRNKCGTTGHYRNEKGNWERCRCLTLEINERRLGQMFDLNPKEKTPLKSKTNLNLIIEGPLSTIRPHVAGALLHLVERKESFVIIDAYRLIEIFLEKDEEFSTSRPVVEAELLVMLLGFGDPRNSYLPDLILQVLNRRELTRKPTWVIMGIELSRVGQKYSQVLQDKISEFEKVGSK